MQRTSPQTRLIGPYTIGHATVGDDPIVVARLTAGTMVVRAFAFVTEDWVTNPPADGHQVYISLGPGSGVLTAYEAIASDSPPDSEPLSPTDARPSIVQRAPAGGADLSVEIYPAQGAFVSGQLAVYALIVDPA